MSEIGTLEALQGLHQELVAACDHRFENVEILRQALQAHAEAFKKLLDKPARSQTSRTAVQSGRITVNDEGYKLNQDFVESTLKLADELELDEVEAAKVLLLVDAEGDVETLGRSLFECGVIRFHQTRKYLLDCMRLCIELTKDDDLDDDYPDFKDYIGEYTEQAVFGAAVPGQGASTSNKIVPRCISAMNDIGQWLQRIAEKVNTSNLMYQSTPTMPAEFAETMDFTRVSLLQQHELLAVIVSAAVDKNHSEGKDFKDFFSQLKRSDRYNIQLIHYFPILGSFVTKYGSTDGNGDLHQARDLNKIICATGNDDTWPLGFLGATVRAWWIAEYSGWYLDDPDLPGVDLDQEDIERSKRFLDSLKEGAFDFMLSIAADCKTPDWRDPARSGMRQWLQRKSPPLVSEPTPFSEFFQKSLMERIETFIDGFISNLPDVLRKLRVEEDEQRQLSQAHEQDLDLERFLLIIAYAYEGRPDAADAFWTDPDSNLAGFLHWASRRASTPLVSAFCEMLQAISDNSDCATAAHHFLLDEGRHSSGKMRRSQSLTWNQVFKELVFFTNKIRERPSPAQSNAYRAGRPNNELIETEPESAMMLECYLMLMTKLATESEEARQMLLRDPNFNLVELLFQLASSVVPPRLRACVFNVLRALLSRKTQEEQLIMWRCVENWMTGGYAIQPSGQSKNVAPAGQNPTALMEAIFQEIGEGFEEPNAFILFLTCLVTPVEGYAPLNDILPFPEDLGSTVRQPGIDLYIDYVIGHVFGYKSSELMEASQLRILRLNCLEFVMTCLETFNEDLIIVGNETNIDVDSAIGVTDLATYVRLHPFSRVMEWMFNDKVMDAIFSTIHQDPSEVGNAAPDSPIVLSVLRGIEVVTKVLDIQDTYLDLVRPLVKLQSAQRRQTVSNAAYATFEDGLMNHLNLVVDLGRFCGIGYPDLTLASLKLLEKVSTSSKIISAWNPGAGRHAHRNKAIVALEANGEAEAIAISLSAELTKTLDFGRKTETSNYLSKVYILNFLYECLKANPEQPSIAHVVLGFRCGVNNLAVEPNSPFDNQKSLFHNLMSILLEVPYGENEQDGVSGWLVTLKTKALRILQVLWNAKLSAAIVTDELRSLKFPFHLLLRETLIEPQLRWDGWELNDPEFLLRDGSLAYIDFLTHRGMVFEYVAMELCSVSQNRLPSAKREILDALGGQIKGDDNETITVPNVFHLFDFIHTAEHWDVAEPQFQHYKDLDLKACATEINGAVVFDVNKVNEVILLKRNEGRREGLVIPEDQLVEIEAEEQLLKDYLIYSNRRNDIAAIRLKVLQAWTKLVLILLETNEFKGTDKATLFQQALQAILPSLETFITESQPEALELAKLAKVLLFKIDFSPELNGTASLSQSNAIAKTTPLNDKLFQLFQICLNAIAKWTGGSDLRAIYYSICYRYITGITDAGPGFASARLRSLKAIHVYGERLLNVLCDDAYGSDTACQTSALILLGAFVTLGRTEDDATVVETLNRLNFIGILVDSLKSIMAEWLDLIRSNPNPAQELYISAKLSLLLNLAQTRQGAKYVLHANLLRVLELSGLFAADPELEIDPSDLAGLEKHYSLIVKVARVVAAAVVRQGNHNVLQGRRFLTSGRGLVVHVLKRSVGIGGGGNAVTGTTAGKRETLLELEERIEELAEAFMVLIAATGFLEFEDEKTPSEKPKGTPKLFH